MNRKVKALVLLASLFIFLLLGSYSYSKYRSSVTGNAQADIAKWKIRVNGCDIVQPDQSNSACFESIDNGDGTITVVKNFNNFDFTYSNGDSNVVENKIAPGSNGSFNVEIEPRDTEVSIKYTITSYIVDDDYSLKYYVKGPTDTVKREMTSSSYEGYILYDPSRSINYKHIIEFSVEWTNLDTDEANEKDTAIGTKDSNPKLEIPVQIRFEQYNG